MPVGLQEKVLSRVMQQRITDFVVLLCSSLLMRPSAAKTVLKDSYRCVFILELCTYSFTNLHVAMAISVYTGNLVVSEFQVCCNN